MIMKHIMISTANIHYPVTIEHDHITKLPHLFAEADSADSHELCPKLKHGLRGDRGDVAIISD